MPLEFSTSEKLRLALRLTFLAPGQIFACFVRSLIISWSRGIPPRLFLVCAVIKVILGSFSPRQIQYLSLSTKATYESWVRRRGSKTRRDVDSAAIERLRYDVEPLEDGNSSLLWLGNRRKAETVVLFFHGGGYISPLLPGHLEWCWRAYVNAGIEMNTEVAVAVLEYTLCPHARYPVQLRQAASALDHLLSQGIRPRNIVIGGDSAGGHLTAQLLHHLVEPHPTVRTIVLSEPLLGAFLVSPWLSRHTHDASFVENAWIDMLSAQTVHKSTRELLGHTKIDKKHHELANLAFPLDRDRSYLSAMTSTLNQLYVTVGTHEVFRDQAGAFVIEVQVSNPTLNVRFDMRDKEAHDFILLEGQEERNGESIEAMKSWMKDLLAASIHRRLE